MSFWDKNKFFEKLLIFTWIGILFICLFFLSFTSHAISSNYFPMGQNDNGKVGDDIISFVENTYSGDYYWLVLFSLEHLSYADTYVCIYFPKSSNVEPLLYGEIKSNTHGFSFYNFSQNYSIKYRYITKYASNGNVSWSSNGGTSWSEWNNMLESSLYSTTFSYVSNFQIYTDSSKQNIILKYSDGPVVGIGHATLPDSFEDPVVNSGSNHTLPREVPESPTINNYIWITYNPPAIDTSNAESLLESLIYVINYLAGWLRDNLSGEFQNLISNINGLLNYIGETLQYYGGLIISNIQNGIQTFYNNMVSLFEPISATITYISEPVSGTVIYDKISNTSLVTNINSINTSLTDFKTSFENLSEPSSFTIPIHLENLPSAYFGNQTIQYIDLGIIGSTEKGIIRIFMWALITYGLFITIVDSVSNYINGGGDES